MMTKELAQQDDYEIRALVLKNNVFGWLTEDELSFDERLGNLLAEIPVALEIVAEARSTISRLREENAELRAKLSADTKVEL